MFNISSSTSRKEIADARAILKFHGVKGKLLAAPTSNPKVEKNLKLGVMTAPMHLSPANLSGHNVCPMASAGCKAACLHTAGNPAYMAQKASSRDAKTKAFFSARPEFMVALVAEIAALVRKAHRENYAPAIRLNATSDIRWEREKVTIGGVTYANVMQAFPQVDFYDYTKIANRKNLPDNYSLTFSLAENNDKNARKALANGMNVAVVFTTKRNRDLPLAVTFDNGELYATNNPNKHKKSVPVIDGDEHDYRPADARGVIVGLRAKGDAIGDTTGFVRQAA